MLLLRCGSHNEDCGDLGERAWKLLRCDRLKAVSREFVGSITVSCVALPAGRWVDSDGFRLVDMEWVLHYRVTISIESADPTP